MHTELADFMRGSAAGAEAESILRKCVHCGFCTATCPTYQLFGDERDSPRGRIYLIKKMLEGEPTGASTQLHLDRCLTCRACETTCPSGVEYGRLLDIGREIAEQKVPRPLAKRLQIWVLREFLSRPILFAPALRLAQHLRRFAPAALRQKIPSRNFAVDAWPEPRHVRRMMLFEGCVQPALAPEINLACARVFDAMGISLIRQQPQQCCGAIRQHLHDGGGALATAKRNIDAWWPLIQSGEISAIVLTSSACAVQLKDYAYLLRNDSEYVHKAQQMSIICQDLAEVVSKEVDSLVKKVAINKSNNRLAFHAPCTLQHGLRLKGVVEDLLGRLGFNLTVVADAHLCCGSAGTYSILQAKTAQELRRRKLENLEAGVPDSIVSANIGCISHLSGENRKVRHWIEVVAEELSN